MFWCIQMFWNKTKQGSKQCTAVSEDYMTLEQITYNVKVTLLHASMYMYHSLVMLNDHLFLRIIWPWKWSPVRSRPNSYKAICNTGNSESSSVYEGYTGLIKVTCKVKVIILYGIILHWSYWKSVSEGYLTLERSALWSRSHS